ncbi:MAG: hypothetical protein U0797_22995 [Gemmataceae bacterium]
MRRILASLVGLTVVSSLASAQAPVPVRLRWAPGQVLLYRVEHVTEANDLSAEAKNETKSVLRATRRWQVLHVDAAGVATLQMSIVAMYQERTTPGDVVKFDSANPQASTPQLREAMSKFLDTPLATIRVDPFGRVVEVKESKSAPVSYENELPFLVLLPAAGMKPNDAWQRDYKITLPPPLGTGEKTDAVQKYVCKGINTDAATVAVTTDFKEAPKAALDAVPLWQLMPEGEVVFDVKNGRLHSAKLTISKELKNHQGENSSMTYKSTLTVTYAGDR